MGYALTGLGRTKKQWGTPAQKQADPMLRRTAYVLRLVLAVPRSSSEPEFVKLAKETQSDSREVWLGQDTTSCETSSCEGISMVLDIGFTWIYIDLS